MLVFATHSHAGQYDKGGHPYILHPLAVMYSLKTDDEELQCMDIRSGCGYPAASLSNFTPHPLMFDGVAVASMEGLLQSFEFDKEPIQVEVCKLVSKAAKFRGKKKDWRPSQTLHWKGVDYPRGGQGYQDLLDRAYHTMCDQNEGFRKALVATNQEVITHSIGKSKESDTVLTEREFCSRLMKMRREIQDLQSTVLKF